MAWGLRMRETALGIGLGGWSVAGVGLVGSGDCCFLDAGKLVFGMNAHCSTLAASSVAVVPPEDSYIGAGDGGPVQHGRCHLSSMP